MSSRDVLGDPSIWGEETLSSEQTGASSLAHASDIRILELPYTKPVGVLGPEGNDLAEMWKLDSRRIHGDIFPVRYGNDFFNNLKRWNFRTIVAVDFAKVCVNDGLEGSCTECGRLQVGTGAGICPPMVA